MSGHGLCSRGRAIVSGGLGSWMRKLFGGSESDAPIVSGM